jgi:hypothetical protein
MHMSMKRTATVALVVVALGVVGAGAGYAVTHNWSATPAGAAAGTTASTASTDVTLPPGGQDPAEATVSATDSARPSSGQTVATDTPVVATSSTVPVVMTYSGWNASARQVMVGGYVSGVIESGGTCTLTLSRAGARVTAHGPARPDAATTACGGLTVPGTSLTSGTWKAVLSYASKASAGTSSAVDIDVTP